MTATRDPSALGVDERLAELAEILARGYIRALARGRISSRELDYSPEAEAPCPSTVNSQETVGKERA